MHARSSFETPARLAAVVGVLIGLLLLAGSGHAAAEGDEPPVNVVAFPNAPGAVTLTWVHSGDDVFWFEIEQESPLTFTAADRDKRVWTIAGLTPDTTYRYRVCAVYDFNRVCSDANGVGYVSVRTLPPERPQGSGDRPAPSIYTSERGEDWVRVCWNSSYDYSYYLVDWEEKGVRNMVAPIEHENGGKHGCQRIPHLQPARTYVVIVQGCNIVPVPYSNNNCYAWSAPYEVATLAWRLIDDNRATIGIWAAGADLYQMHRGGSIWKYTGTPRTGWQQLDNNPQTRTIAASGGNLYKLHTDGSIWRYTGAPGGWQRLDDNRATAEIVADGGNLYQRHFAGSVWRYTGTPGGWQRLDEDRGQEQIAAGGGNLYKRHHDGEVWKYAGTPGNWQRIGGNLATELIRASGNNVYEMHLNRSIWRYQGAPMAWQFINGYAGSRDIVADGDALFQIHDDGKIWRYMGAPDQWEFIDGNSASKGITAGGGKLYQMHENGAIWVWLR